ncbi:ubiquitin, putative [Bodo saltans]|uniref:Ubiquitin, putative n=1 Tax=Bodo saltans TaxID=75058 RepID=A0A0S4IZZ9_BODSA|nr:ubiquitin, putative [Bodo saltans]|eukprot:CUG30284.1 ubiquitin, putative [Bodo saltans]
MDILSTLVVTGVADQQYAARKTFMPAGDIPQRERRVVYTYLVEHEFATVSKLFAQKAQKKKRTRKALATKPTTVKPIPAKKAAVKRAPVKAPVKKAAKKTTISKKAQKVTPKKTLVKKDAPSRAKKASTKATKPPARTTVVAKPPSSRQLKPKTQRVSLVAAPAQHRVSTPPALPVYPPPQPTIAENSVTIQTLGGLSKVISIEPSSTTVSELKQKIQGVTGVPVDQQRLIGNGQVLTPDEALLRDVGVHRGAQVYLILRLRGSA